MALKYSASAPSGWLVNENNQFVKVTPTEYESVKTSAASTPTAPPSNAPQQGTSSGSAPSGTVKIERQQWVDDLYKKYFDRVATDAEMANWRSLQPQQLETFLQADAKKYGYTSEYFRKNQQSGIDKASALIDADPNLTPEMKALAKQVVQSYQGGIEADAPAILKAFDEVKKTTIDPYYADLINQTTTLLKDNVAKQQASRQIELEQQGLTEGKAIEQTQQNLEATGKTFTGEAVQQLGGQSAYSAAQLAPFGGAPEGRVQQESRLVASSTQNRYLEGLKELGRTAESALGTTGVAGVVPGYQAMGGMTGSIQTQRQKEYGQTLREIAGNQQSKVNLLTNKSVL